MPAASPVTQKDVASRAGVTPVLVSRALSGHPSVAAGTRLRIEEAARELGYNGSSNLDARSLIAKRYGKRVRTDVVAVLTPASFFGGMAVPRLPYFAPFIEGIEQAACQRELDIHLCSPRNGRLPRLVERGGVDGVVSLVGDVPEVKALGLPTVNYGGPGGWMTGLMPDSRRGAKLATEHLLALGHRRIACLAFSASFYPGHWYAPAADRIDGYRDAMAAAGIAVDESLIGGHASHPTVENGREALETMFREGAQNFTGLVCFNDMLAMGAIETLRARGLSVPEDVSVVGFDDVSQEHGFSPALTSVRFDRFAMGCRAVELLCEARERDEHKIPGTAPDEVFPVELAVRESSAPRRVVR